jgi:hypothetical protein
MLGAKTMASPAYLGSTASAKEYRSYRLTRMRYLRLQGWAKDVAKDNLLISILLRCKRKPVRLNDVLNVVGVPDIAWGSICNGGIIYYFRRHPFGGTPRNACMFDVRGGEITGGGTNRIDMFLDRQIPGRRPTGRCTGPRVGRGSCFTTSPARVR